MRIAALLVIYQVVTSSGRNISRLDGPGLCLKVLGTLSCASPLTALSVHPEQRVVRCGNAAVVTHEEHCRSVNSQPPAGSPLVVGDYCVSRRPNIAIRQQFHVALLEDCSFFAHLVLRCVRGGDGSHLGAAVPREGKPQLVFGIQRRTQPVTRSCAQRELEDLDAGAREASFQGLETLWADMASRHVRIAVREGEMP